MQADCDSGCHNAAEPGKKPNGTLLLCMPFSSVHLHTVLLVCICKLLDMSIIAHMFAVMLVQEAVLLHGGSSVQLHV